MVLQIECARCKVELRLDGGFAAGVCRCVHCGGLMKVPQRIADQQAAATAPNGQVERTAAEPSERPDHPPEPSQLASQLRSGPGRLAAVSQGGAGEDSVDELASPRAFGRRELLLIAVVIVQSLMLLVALGAIVYLL